MPPPPPPSKSYLLVIDTDSEDDEDDGYDDDYDDDSRKEKGDIQVEQNSSSLRDASSLVDSFRDTTMLGSQKEKETLPSFLIQELEHDKDDENEDDQSKGSSCTDKSSTSSPTTSTNTTTTTTTCTNSQFKKTKRKRAKKKRNRNKKKSSTTTTGTASATTKQHHNVSFGSVDLRLYERSLGGDGVPSDGGWPLCLTSTVLEESHMALDDFEDYRRSLLQDRLRELQDQISSSSSSKSSLQPFALETRQWDYKKERDAHGHSIRNPLFSPLDEDERQQLLVTGKPPKFSAITSAVSSSSSSHTHATRSRPRSISIDTTLDCPFDPVDVRHIRNELEDLRVERSKEQGCTCRKFQVYGKKNRTSISKLNAELKKRNQLPTKTCTRDELEHLLHTLIEMEPCCSNQFHNNNSCPCVQNGLGCQADACSCWSTNSSSNSNSSNNSSSTHASNKKDPSNATSTTAHEAPTSVIQLQQRCGNTYGMYVVDLKAISNFRKQIIAQYDGGNDGGAVGNDDQHDKEEFYCQVIPETTVS